VIVLERVGSGGGTSAMAGGQIYLGAGTPLQTKMGFDDDIEEMFKYLMASCGPEAPEDKIRLFCEQSVAHYHWLTDLGVPFKMSYLGPEITTDPHTDDGLTWTGSELAYPYDEIAKPAPRGHTVQLEGANAGLLLMDKLIAAAEERGAKLQTLAKTETLVQRDEDKRIVGVKVYIEGELKYVRVRKGVVLCTGGFIRNKEMIARYARDLQRVKLRVSSPSGDDGSGILMGMGAGGDAINMDAAMIALPYSPPRQLLYGVLVNGQGQRYCNEDLYQSNHGEIAIRHQKGEVYLIVDDETFARPEAPAEILAVGETYEELEGELGMPKGSLVHTMQVYNEHAAKGEDPYFHKRPAWLEPLDNPPYAAFDMREGKALYAAFTMGGLRTLPTGEVVTPNDAVIPGLYAAGRTTSGMPAYGYNSGLSLADTTFFGRMAGISVAQNDDA